MSIKYFRKGKSLAHPTLFVPVISNCDVSPDLEEKYCCWHIYLFILISICSSEIENVIFGHRLVMQDLDVYSTAQVINDIIFCVIFNIEFDQWDNLRKMFWRKKKHGSVRRYDGGRGQQTYIRKSHLSSFRSRIEFYIGWNIPSPYLSFSVISWHISFFKLDACHLAKHIQGFENYFDKNHKLVS